MNFKLNIYVPLFVSLFISVLTSFSLKKNEETWTIPQTSSKFTIDIPENFSAELQEVRPNNFQTMAITGPLNIPDSEKVSIGITTSYFPTYYESPYFKEPPKTDNLKIKLLGSSMEFLIKNFKSQLFVAEQIISLDNVKQGLKLEIRVISTDQKKLKKSLNILKTLTITNAAPLPKPSIMTIDPNTKCIYNNYRLVTKYGTILPNGKLITGSQYFYNDNRTLSKIVIFKDGVYQRDSLFN